MAFLELFFIVSVGIAVLSIGCHFCGWAAKVVNTGRLFS
jgi:hypothetical protein